MKRYYTKKYDYSIDNFLIFFIITYSFTYIIIITKKENIMEERELNAQTTDGPMSIPGDFKGKWFVLFSHPAGI
jgi:hypothetical protein